jgi:hypothetical protein
LASRISGTWAAACDSKQDSAEMTAVAREIILIDMMLLPKNAGTGLLLLCSRSG